MQDAVTRQTLQPDASLWAGTQRDWLSVGGRIWSQFHSSVSKRIK